MKNICLKNTIIFLISFSFMISCSKSQGEKNDLNEMNLKDKVKSLFERNYEAVEKFGKAEKGNCIDSLNYFFNENGFKAEEVHYSNRLIYRYDNKGKLIELNGYNNELSLQSKSNYEYDINGNLIEVNYFDKNKPKVLSLDELVGKTKEIKQNSTNTELSLASKSILSYDDKGNNIETNCYHSDGSLRYRYTYKYDMTGNKLEDKDYNLNGRINRKNTYKYDNNNNLIELNIFDTKLAFGSSINDEPTLSLKITYKYDENGNVVEEIRFLEDGSINKKISHKYNYDKKKNWIKEIVYEDNIIKGIIERNIIYF